MLLVDVVIARFGGLGKGNCAGEDESGGKELLHGEMCFANKTQLLYPGLLSSLQPLASSLQTLDQRHIQLRYFWLGLIRHFNDLFDLHWRQVFGITVIRQNRNSTAGKAHVIGD